MPFQVFGHALRLGERLVRTLATGHNAYGVRVGLKIVDGLIKPILQHQARTGLMHLRAKYDHIIQSRFTSGAHATDYPTFDRTKTDKTRAKHHTAYPAHYFRQCLPPAEPYCKAGNHE